MGLRECEERLRVADPLSATPFPDRFGVGDYLLRIGFSSSSKLTPATLGDRLWSEKAMVRSIAFPLNAYFRCAGLSRACRRRPPPRRPQRTTVRVGTLPNLLQSQSSEEF